MINGITIIMKYTNDNVEIKEIGLYNPNLFKKCDECGASLIDQKDCPLCEFEKCPYCGTLESCSHHERSYLDN